MWKIDSRFIANFKLGDNIVTNLQTCSLLYSYYSNESDVNKILLRKPMIIGLISVLEAVLHDFHYRIKTFTKEGVQNLSNDIINYIQGKHLDELGKYITSAKTHDLFDEQNSDFYDALDDLRKIRNRVRIQNTRNHFEPNESEAFCEEFLKSAEKCLEITLKVMQKKYVRPNMKKSYVADFELPWIEHFP